MTAFIFKLLFAIAAIITATKFATWRRDEGKFPLYRLVLPLRVLGALFVLWAVIGTSMIWVSSGKFATFKRIYFGSSLPPGRIVALDGELGPQARIMTAGFHWEFFVNITHDIEEVDVFNVPSGSCAMLSAKDGLPISGGSAFAEQWSDADRLKMVNDARYFLTEGKGVRGPQVTVLTPGSYTINPYLWEEPQVITSTRVEQGTVGVVKSSVHGSVDFGNFKREKPTDNTLKILTGNKLPKDAAGALIVPVGGIGVWEEPLPNGLYYINTSAYKITMVPTVAQVYEYRGGYKRRTVDISVNDKGQVDNKVREEEVQTTPEDADSAIFIKPEGWDVAQELRVLAQVSPEMAPFVVASLGLTQENASKLIEDRVVTPIIRSVVREVGGGAQIAFKQQKAVLDPTGKTILKPDGEPQTELVHEFRPVKVMDLLENRASLEDAVEVRSKPEALKEGVTIMEVRLAESAIPAELLIARKREQLAEQLMKAWKQEEQSQKQRQLTENARAQAEQQTELVKAEIAAKAAKERANARETEAKGEQAYLLAVAQGQEAQSKVLGQETTARLQMFQQTLKMIEGVFEKNPEIILKGLENAHKFVPSVVVGNSGGGLEGPAAIFGHLMGGADKLLPPATEQKQQ